MYIVVSQEQFSYIYIYTNTLLTEDQIDGGYKGL